MNSDNLKNISGERENLSADEQKICNLIGKLEKVECPKNFDFRLKARIASADKKDFQPSIRQTLRYVLPVAACVLIAAFVLVQAGIFSPSGGQQGSEITAVNPNVQPFDASPPTVPIVSPSNSNTSESSVNRSESSPLNPSSNTETALKNPSEKRSESLPKLSKEDEPTMWRDFGVRPNRKQIYPRGIDPNQIKPQKIENQNAKPVSAKSVFDFIGMETEFNGGKLRVKSVKAKGLADISGIKIGDLVESVDDTKIDKSEMTLKSSGVKKITVSREGKPLEISLQPK